MRARPESGRPFRKPGRRRERRRKAWQSLLPARCLRVPGQIVARPSRARRRFESHRRWRRIVRRDRAAARDQAERESEDVKSWLYCASSIRQLGFGFGQGRIANWDEEGAPIRQGRTQNERTGLKTGHYKDGQSPIMMRLQNVCKTHKLEYDPEPAERSVGGAPHGGESAARFDRFESHGMRVRI